MKIIELKKHLQEFEENIIYNADLKKKTWFNIGGKAKVFFRPNELKDLIKFLKILNNKEKIHVIGAGSNTLISGKNFNRLSILNSNVIISGAAVYDKKLSEFAAKNGLSGFEFLYCIPGTVGGAINMNAGCFKREIKDILISVQALDKNGNILTITEKDIKFEYRSNNLSEDLIFLSASFRGLKMNPKQIKENMMKFKNKKDLNQPTKIKTSGSTFKNPVNKTTKKAWELIKECVPDNIKFGDASISSKHSNFFVNNGNATFNDMKKLIDFVSLEVLKKTGIQLEKEIKIIE
jgi:UDP-N-acetylmuramate dehydrogenase